MQRPMRFRRRNNGIHWLRWCGLMGALRVAGILGDIEVHSSYRNPSLNACAGGAARSAHMRSFRAGFHTNGRK